MSENIHMVICFQILKVILRNVFWNVGMLYLSFSFKDFDDWMVAVLVLLSRMQAQAILLTF